MRHIKEAGGGAAKDKAYGVNRITALLSAVMSSLDEVVCLLLKDGVDKNKGDKYGNTPPHWAINRGEASCITQMLLIFGVDGDKANESGQVPLHWAAIEGYACTVRALLDAERLTKTRHFKIYFIV